MFKIEEAVCVGNVDLGVVGANNTPKRELYLQLDSKDELPRVFECIGKTCQYAEKITEGMKVEGTFVLDSYVSNKDGSLRSGGAKLISIKEKTVQVAPQYAPQKYAPPAAQNSAQPVRQPFKKY
jgi:hypothetical protein